MIPVSVWYHCERRHAVTLYNNQDYVRWIILDEYLIDLGIIVRIRN